MAINKANTPVWMKVTLVILAIVFASSFVTVSAQSCSDTGGLAATNAATDPVESVKAQYQPTIDSLNSVLKSDPESYTVLVQLGDTYFNWADALLQQSQTSTAAAAASGPLWISAKDSYARALEVKKGESPVTVDYSFALFYSGETSKAIEVAEGVTKADPEFAMAPLALGNFRSYLGDSAGAINDFQKYLDLDPKDKWGNVEFAKGRIAELKGGATTTP